MDSSTKRTWRELWHLAVAVFVMAGCGGQDGQGAQSSIDNTAGAHAVGSSFVFYTNGALQDGWWDNSWVTRTLNGTAVLDGTNHTLSVTFNPWGAVNFYGGTAASTAGLDTFDVRVNGGANKTPAISLQLQFNGSGFGNAVAIGPYCTGGAIPTNAWADCQIPLSELGSGSTVTGIWFDNGGSSLSAMYISTFQLTNSAPPPTCTSWTYSAWTPCQSDGMQTRTVLSSSPAGCVGGSPITEQTCTYAPPPTCTSWTYSSWGACQSDDVQTRTVLISSPVGCAGGSPILTQSCTYVPSAGTAIQAGAITTQTWGPAGSPYRIYGDVYIPTGNTLTILPGTQVRFQGHYRFEGPGILNARGTSPSQRDILFTAEDTTIGWYGVRIWNWQNIGQPPDVGDYYLENCIIEYVVKDRSNPRSFQDTDYNDSRGALYVLGVSSWNPSCPNSYCGLTPDRLHIDGTLFRYNTAASTESPYGGGAAIYFNSFLGLFQPVWANMEFDNNESASYGAVFTQHHAGPVTFTDCIMSNNHAIMTVDDRGYPSSGTVGYWDVTGPVTLEGCTLTNNTPTGFGSTGAPNVIVE